MSLCVKSTPETDKRCVSCWNQIDDCHVATSIQFVCCQDDKFSLLGQRSRVMEIQIVREQEEDSIESEEPQPENAARTKFGCSKEFLKQVTKPWKQSPTKDIGHIITIGRWRGVWATHVPPKLHPNRTFRSSDSTGCENNSLFQFFLLTFLCKLSWGSDFI